MDTTQTVRERSRNIIRSLQRHDLPIRNPDFPSEHLAHQVFGLFGGNADAFDRFYQGRAVQAKRAETVGQS
jgi:hypothetical protein